MDACADTCEYVCIYTQQAGVRVAWLFHQQTSQEHLSSASSAAPSSAALPPASSAAILSASLPGAPELSKSGGPPAGKGAGWGRPSDRRIQQKGLRVEGSRGTPSHRQSALSLPVLPHSESLSEARARADATLPCIHLRPSCGVSSRSINTHTHTHGFILRRAA